MEALMKLVDAILLFLLTFVAIGAPIIDAQICLPQKIYPSFLVDVYRWFSREFDDYLFVEKPHFFVGLVWLKTLLIWPLTIVNLYGIIAGKSWLNKTCLVLGVSIFTVVVPILADMLGSGKASDKMLMGYSLFLGFGILAAVRGLLPQSGKTTKTVLNQKKRI